MRDKSIKIDLLLLIICFFSIKLSIIAYINDLLNIMYYIGQIFVLLILLFMNLRIKKFNKFDFGVILFYLLILISTLINNSYLIGFFKDLFGFIILYLATRYYINVDFKKYSKYMYRLLLFYTIINTLFALIYYPKAPIYDGFNPIFLLGGDNTSVRLYVLCVMFGFLPHDSNLNKKIPILSILNLLIFSYIRDIGTGKVCTLIMIIGAILFKVNFKPLKKVMKFTAFFHTIFFAILIIFNKINLFSYFIVNILHRTLSLTERTIIWQITIDKIIKKPIFGYGFIEGSVFEKMLPYITGVNAHNTFLMITFVGGVLSLILFLILFIISIKKFESKKHLYCLYMIPFSLFCLLFHSQVEGWDTTYIIIILAMIYGIDQIEKNTLMNSKDEE